MTQTIAQKEIITIQGKDNIYYTGAWTGYGFHEDGIKSAVDVAVFKCKNSMG